MLRVIKKLKEKSRLCIRATFLAAHNYPLQYKENCQGYIDCIINDMLPIIAHEKLADYIDIFCESSFFSVAEIETICHAGMRCGLKSKLHVNQLSSISGIKKGLQLKAISIDHLETLDDNDINLLGNQKTSFAGEVTRETICTLLPTAAFFLRMSFQPRT